MAAFTPKRLLAGFTPEQSEAIQSEFNRVAQDLLSRDRDAAPEIRTDDVVARTNQFLRMSPQVGGQALILPPPRSTVLGDAVTVSVENPVGTLSVQAVATSGEAGVEAATVNGQGVVTFTKPGLVVFTSNGESNWTTASEHPAETAAVSAAGFATANAEPYVTHAAPSAALTNARRGEDSTEIAFTLTTANVVSWVIRAASVALSKLANITGPTVLGKVSGTGVPEALTPTQLGSIVRNPTVKTISGAGPHIDVTLDQGGVEADVLLFDTSSTLHSIVAPTDGKIVRVQAGSGVTLQINDNGTSLISGNYRIFTLGRTAQIIEAYDSCYLESGAGPGKWLMTTISHHMRARIGSGGTVTTERFDFNNSTELTWSTVASSSAVVDFKVDLIDGSVVLTRLADQADDTGLRNVSGSAGPPTADALTGWVDSSTIVYDSTFHYFKFGAGATWAAVNANGATSGAFNPQIDQGQSLLFDVAGDADYTGLSGQILANGAFTLDVDGGLTLSASSTATLSSDALVALDPGAGNVVWIFRGFLLFTEQSSSSPTVSAGNGMLWIRDDAPNVAMFTDDTNVDHQLAYLNENAGALIKRSFRKIADASWSVTPDAATTWFRATWVAGGGGGGGADAETDGETSVGAGGGAGGYCEQIFTIVSGNITGAVGAGGGGGSAAGGDGSDGGNSTVIYNGTTVTATGGKGGAGMAAGAGAGGSSEKAAASKGGDGGSDGSGFGHNGGDGGNGFAYGIGPTQTRNAGVGGHGAASFYGQGGNGGVTTWSDNTTSDTGGAGQGSGSGGGGACRKVDATATATGAVGGAGAAGSVVIEEFTGPVPGSAAIS